MWMQIIAFYNSMEMKENTINFEFKIPSDEMSADVCICSSKRWQKIFFVTLAPYRQIFL